ncbi:uncharacterized protein beat-IIIa [Drosophila virilis]|uniref:Uncharacterized protein, isoform A n=1 Tax=Drosophila virilis TaxID=7244 RepID=B4MDF3_DROVI|nr:uncharacterized protein LOC6635719 [Drosophila virilis]XP_015024426.1 uncharacterized protein LOC6635719 [Drosophila virilis]XP_032294685.1 uncharacterized protein LOC6635719 [Drosophila virilis]EDW71214.1 uncharacterized protein Dvir_GJ16186, isoform A [Drosophila virilis]KRF85567.1 uncharacterized protein Dvir_GJ16186, isoform B [Drosophila virilis]KRF85568.1 uncharacterized protein Dvir_GJ16186, isoform C [Drosophila virilis]
MCSLEPYTHSHSQSHRLSHRHNHGHRPHHRQQHQQQEQQKQLEQQDHSHRQQHQAGQDVGLAKRTTTAAARTTRHLQLWHILHVILVLIDITSSLTMTEVKIPNHIMRLKSALLGCRYSLDGESLYSVKWYKDGHEIYRYVPRDKPPGQAFPLPGVNIDLRNSSDTQVMLRRVTLQTSGLYRCEVSGEAPAFNTVSESETMTVVVTPNHGPKISGGQPRYQIGDTVRVNCTSAPSKPVCHLSWLINGEPAQKQHLKQYDKIVMGRDSLEMARLGLEFRVRGYHFKNGDMKLKCVAKISSLYWQSNEESVESDRQQRAPALESRETVAAKSSTIGAAASRQPSHLISLLPALLLLFGAVGSWSWPPEGAGS